MTWGASVWGSSAWAAAGGAWGSGTWGSGAWGSSGSGGAAPAPPDDLATLKSLMAAYSFGPSTPPKSWVRDSSSISASILPFAFTDMQTSVVAVGGVSLQAYIVAVVGNLTASIFSVAYSALSATGGGHYPAALSAAIGSIPPSHINAFVRAYYAGTPAAMGATATAAGYWGSFTAVIRSTGPGSSDFGASVFAWLELNMPAVISGWESSSLPASISHNYRGPDLRALIRPHKAGYIDMGVFLRPASAGAIGVSAFIRPVISAHTGPKQRNMGYWKRPFLSNKVVIGTRGGITFLTPEAIYSYSPDLAATIQGQPFIASNISAFLRAYTAASSTMPSGIFGVTPKVYVNKVMLNYTLFKMLKASITKVGGHVPLRTSIKSIQRGVTGTSAEGGFRSTYAVSGAVLFGEGGLVILPSTTSSIKRSSFLNSHHSPDLHAVLTAWATAGLSASIKSYPSASIGAAVRVLDWSRVSHFPAVIQSQTPSSVTASISSTGWLEALSASVSAVGAVASFPAIIVGYPEVLGREFVAVHTKPFSTMAAYINYDQTFSCSRASEAIPLSARISTWYAGVGDLSVSIIAQRGEAGLAATIMGRKRVMLKFLDVYYRTSTRGSVGMPAHITGWKREVESDFGATLVGKSHEVDIAAGITGIRLRTSSTMTAKDVLLVDVRRPENRITAEVLFASGVSSYIYDAVRGAVYSMDTSEEWAVLVQEQRVVSSFFDRPADLKSRQISIVADYDSFDEAVRAALDSMASLPSVDFGASISAGGASSNFTASIYSDTADTVANLGARIYEVRTIPDITATLVAAGAITSFFASVKSLEAGDFSLQTSVTGWAGTELLASVTVVP